MFKRYLKKLREYRGKKKIKHLVRQALFQDATMLTPYEKRHGELPELLSGDIVLIRHKKNQWLRKLQRIALDTYWDHSALVLYRKDLEKGYTDPVILELKNDLLTKSYYFGSALHKLSKYLNDPEEYDIGIKRVPWLTKEQRQRVRAVALSYVDEPYYPYFHWKFFKAIFSDDVKKEIRYFHRFACSSLIQKAFYEGVGMKDRDKVIFKVTGKRPLQLLDTVSPSDLAISTASEWIFNERR